MLKAYKYKLDLNKAQREFMMKSFGCARVVYNYALNRRNEAYQKKEKAPTQFDLCKDVVRLKKTEEYHWLSEVDHQSLCCSVQNLDKAFSNFFRKKSQFPKFKSRRGKQSCQFTQGINIDFEKGKVRFPKIGWVNAFLSRRFEGKIKTTTVTMTPCGMLFVSMLVDNGEALPTKQAIREETAIGIDVGLKHFAILSNGTKIDNPKYLESSQKRLSVLQRRHSRKQKGSKNREKARIKAAKLHYKISNQRNDFLHKTSTMIIRENQTVIIEDLNVEGMLKNHCLAKSISSASWSSFFNMLTYKADWHGRNLLTIGRFEPSSKLCTCGEKNNDLKLSDRDWTCKKCGAIHDRDLLAANNIKRFGLTKQNLLSYSGAGSPSEPVESSAVAGA